MPLNHLLDVKCHLYFSPCISCLILLSEGGGRWDSFFWILKYAVSPQSYEYKHTSYLNTVIFLSSAASISIKTKQPTSTASTLSPHSHSSSHHSLLPYSLNHSLNLCVVEALPQLLYSRQMWPIWQCPLLPTPCLGWVSFWEAKAACFSLPLAPSCKSSIPGCRQRKLWLFSFTKFQRVG